MVAEPFEPVGEVARWVPIYEHMRKLGPDVIVTYAELSELAGVDILTNRSPVAQANKKLLKQNQRGLVNVRGVGYRIMHPSEHAEQARTYNRKADGAFVRAIRVLDGADRNELTPAQRDYAEAMSGALKAQRDMNRRLTRRQNDLDAALKMAREESTKAREEAREIRRETKTTTAQLAQTVEEHSEVLNRLQQLLLDRESTT